MTMMPRTPELELMLDDEQARAYAEADFREPHDRFVRLFQEAFAGEELQDEVLDLGCGPADVSVRFARAYPHCHVLGLDGSPAMLRQGRRLLARHPDVRDRITLLEGLLPLPAWNRKYGTVISNSLLHHLADPQVLWQSVQAAGRPAARVFVVDLRRPADEAEAKRLTALYAAGQPAVLQRDFHHSLLAAFTPEEIRGQLSEARLSHFTVHPVGDRHVMIWGRL